MLHFQPSPKVSYLRARDPSIVTSEPILDNIKCNLEDQFDEEINSTNHDSSNESFPKRYQIEVYLRVKNESLGDIYYLDNNYLICNVPETSITAKHFNKGDKVTRKFEFSKIFPPNSTQEDIFNFTVKSRILDFINGTNGTLFTYGASGAGKTFTIVGTPDYPGVIPRSLEYLFKTLPTVNKVPTIKPFNGGLSHHCLSTHEAENEMHMLNDLVKKFNSKSHIKKSHIKTYRSMQHRLIKEPVASLDDVQQPTILGVWVSFAEIYNECIYDLLVNEPKSQTKLKLCNNKGISYIKDLSSVYVSSGLDAYQLLQYGLENLKIAKTSINADSSRSHCIFTLTLVQADKEGEHVKISCFNFCDLAGSERTKKTHNEGIRLHESNNINNSLLVLGKCIHIIRESQKANNSKLVPFRESKLTQYFQRALCGHEKIAMIVNVNPIPEMFDETLQALNFSAIAKELFVDQPDKNEENKLFSQVSRCKKIITNKDDVIEKQALVITALEEKYQQQMLQYERQESDIRIGIVEKFKTMMDDLDIEHDNRIEYYKTKIDNLRSENFDLHAKLEAEDDSIICLDDSNIGSDEIEEDKIEENFKQQLRKERLSQIALEQEIDTLKSKLVELKLQKQAINEQLQEAALIRSENEKVIESLCSKLLIAKNKICNLEEREEAYRQWISESTTKEECEESNVVSPFHMIDDDLLQKTCGTSVNNNIEMPAINMSTGMIPINISNTIPTINIKTETPTINKSRQISKINITVDSVVCDSLSADFLTTDSSSIDTSSKTLPL